MKKVIPIAFAIASLILIAPITGIASENKVSDNLPEQDIDELVVQIQNVIDEVLEKYGHIPMVRGLCNVIINSLDSIYWLLFCVFLVIITIPIFLIVTIIWTITEALPQILGSLLFLLVIIFGEDCSPSTSLNNLLSPFQSIFTISETNDISDFSDCPCLQEV
jgi:hypothetical protein